MPPQFIVVRAIDALGDVATADTEIVQQPISELSNLPLRPASALLTPKEGEDAVK